MTDLSDGGVFGITGVRGAGKSLLLNKLADHFQNRYHVLSVSAPISANREMEFFLMLFRLLCDSVRTKLRTLIFGERFDLKAIGNREFLKRASIFLTMLAVSAYFSLFFLYWVNFHREQEHVRTLITESKQDLLRSLSEDAYSQRMKIKDTDITPEMKRLAKIPGEYDNVQSAIAALKAIPPLLVPPHADLNSLFQSLQRENSGLTADVSRLDKQWSASGYKIDDLYHQIDAKRGSLGKIESIIDAIKTIEPASNRAEFRRKLNATMRDKQATIRDLDNEERILKEKVDSQKSAYESKVNKDTDDLDAQLDKREDGIKLDFDTVMKAVNTAHAGFTMQLSPADLHNLPEVGDYLKQAESARSSRHLEAESRSRQPLAEGAGARDVL